MSSLETPKRNLVLCAEDTEAGAQACEFAMQFADEHTVFHLVYVVKSLMPPMEVFHTAPGTSYHFDQPGRHDEKKKIEAATRALEKRYVFGALQSALAFLLPALHRFKVLLTK